MSAQEHHDGPSRGPAPDTDDAILLQWTVHLCRRTPARGLVVLAAVVASGVLGWWVFRSPLFVLLGPGLVVTATAEFLFPAHYRLTARRALAAYGAARLEIEWDRVNRVLVSEECVRLSPFGRPSRLEAFRGVHLRFSDAETMSAAMAIVRARARGLQSHA
ncbi:MAG: hypothetical protein NT029_22065 [Armatimonadetes bacterium]|nr:hypothetical protein [Armatimonadota bacterium]